MSAGFKSATETSVIEALDFEYAPPCESTHRSNGGPWVPCDRPAVWCATYRRHCVDEIRTKLLCDKGMADYQRPLGVACDVCGATINMPSYIVRTERIKP